MAIVLAITSSLLSGTAAVYSKLAARNVNVYYVNALSNSVILCIFFLAIVMLGEIEQIFLIETWREIIISGIALALSWIFFYLSIKDGTLSIVLAIQNLSIVFTMIMGELFLEETVSKKMVIGSILILLGSIIMTMKDLRDKETVCKKKWIAYDIISAVFVSISFIFTKIDSNQVSSNVSGMFRYIVVAVIMWLLYYKMRTSGTAQEDKRKITFFYIIMCGLTLGLGYITLYRAMEGGTVSITTTIFRMNIIVSSFLGSLVLKEKLYKEQTSGLITMTGGLLLFSL